MSAIDVLVICVFFSLCQAGWVMDMLSPLNFGRGLSINNTSLLKDNAIRLDYSEFGLSVDETSNNQDIQIKLFLKDGVEGRDSKVAEIAFPALVGFKLTGLLTFTLGGIALLVVKSLGLANLALFITIMIIVHKLRHPEQSSYVEVDHQLKHLPLYTEAITDEYPSASGSLITYEAPNFIPNADESIVNFQAIIANNTPHNNQKAAVDLNRRGYSKGKRKNSIVTIKKYSV